MAAFRKSCQELLAVSMLPKHAVSIWMCILIYCYDDVMTWKSLRYCWTIVNGIHCWPVDDMMLMWHYLSEFFPLILLSFFPPITITCNSKEILSSGAIDVHCYFALPPQEGTHKGAKRVLKSTKSCQECILETICGMIFIISKATWNKILLRAYLWDYCHLSALHHIYEWKALRHFLVFQWLPSNIHTYFGCVCLPWC